MSKMSKRYFTTTTQYKVKQCVTVDSVNIKKNRSIKQHKTYVAFAYKRTKMLFAKGKKSNFC